MLDKRTCERFKRLVGEYAILAGLGEWEIEVRCLRSRDMITPVGESCPRDGSAAINAFGSRAMIVLNKEQCTRERMPFVAGHEVAHVVAGYLGELAHSRYVGEEEINREEEVIANRIGRILNAVRR